MTADELACRASISQLCEAVQVVVRVYGLRAVRMHDARTVANGVVAVGGGSGRIGHRLETVQRIVAVRDALVICRPRFRVYA